MTFTPTINQNEPNSQIQLNSDLSRQVQGASTPLATLDPQNRPGWYYNSTLQTDYLMWTVFNGVEQNFTLGDVQNLTFTATHDNIPTNKCYMAITSTLGSRIVFENNSLDLIPGEKCLFYTKTAPSNPNQLQLVQLNLVTKTGTCSPDEQLMSISLEGTNAVLFPNSIQVCVENIGYLLSFSSVPVIINLENAQLVNVSIIGFSTEATLSNLNTKVHNDTIHTNAIQVEVKNTTSIPVSNDSLDYLTFSGTSLNTVVTNTVPISNDSLTSLTFSGTSLNTVVTNTVPISNDSLTLLTFSGTSLDVNVTNNIPFSNKALDSMTFSGTSLNTAVTNTVPVTNSSLSLLSFSGTSLDVNVTNNIPFSNKALDSMTFSGTSLNTAVTNTVPVTNSSLALLSFSGTSLNTAVTNTVPVTNSSLALLSFSGNSLNTAVTNTVPVTNSSLALLSFSGTSLNTAVTNSSTNNNVITATGSNRTGYNITGLNMYVIPSKTKTFNFSANISNSVENAAIGSNENTQTYLTNNWGIRNLTEWQAFIKSGTDTDLLLTYTYIDSSGNEVEATTPRALTTTGLFLRLGVTINSWSVDKSLGINDEIYISVNNSATKAYSGGNYRFTNNSLFTCPNNAIAWVQNVSFNIVATDVLRLLKWNSLGVRSVMFAFNSSQNFNLTASGEYGFGGYITAGETIGWGGQVGGSKTVYANIVCRYF